MFFQSLLRDNQVAHSPTSPEPSASTGRRTEEFNMDVSYQNCKIHTHNVRLYYTLLYSKWDSLIQPKIMISEIQAEVLDYEYVKVRNMLG